MARIRYAHPNHLYEVSTRTLDGMCLLRPSDEVNSRILGVIGRAQAQTGVRIHGMAFASTHYHMLIGVDSTEQMSSFMRKINSGITTRLNDLNNRTGTSWSGRFHSVLVANDEDTQVSRLRYLMAHGVKEGLVDKVADWPGVSSNGWLLRGEKIEGIWIDFTERYYAHRRKTYVPKAGDFETKYEVKMSVLPCWRGLSEAERHARAAALVEEIEGERRTSEDDEPTPERRASQVQRILSVSPRRRVPRQKRTPQPLVLAASKSVREALERELWAVFIAYGEASARFKSGEWDVEFPAGTFRPGGGFVGVV